MVDVTIIANHIKEEITYSEFKKATESFVIAPNKKLKTKSTLIGANNIRNEKDDEIFLGEKKMIEVKTRLNTIMHGIPRKAFIQEIQGFELAVGPSINTATISNLRIKYASTKRDNL